MTCELHIEPGARASAVRFLESMQSRLRAGIAGAPILGGRALQFVSRTGINGQAHGAQAGARTPRYTSASAGSADRCPNTADEARR